MPSRPTQDPKQNIQPQNSDKSKKPQEGFASGGGELPVFIPRADRLEKKKKTPFSELVKLYFIPIVTLIIFAGVMFFVIRGVSTVVERLDQISQLNTQSAELDTEIANLQILSSNSESIESDLGRINYLVPTGVTEVTKFQNKVRDLAEKRGLRVLEADTTESTLATIEEGSISPLGVIEIPSNFVIQGQLWRIEGFIADIQLMDDFVIIGEMNLHLLVGAGGLWNLDLVLIKYQFQVPDENNKLAEVFARVPPTAKEDEEVLTLLRRGITN